MNFCIHNSTNHKFGIKLLLCLVLAIQNIIYSQNNVAEYVNPFIGTGGHGHTFPGAVLPFGMVQLSPDTRIDGSWDGCSGYHYSDSIIYGFSHTHLSGTGCSDWGDVMLMPFTGQATVDNKLYSSKFDHSKESAQAGAYSVFLKDDQIQVDLTTTLRTGVHRYTFPDNCKKGRVVLDLLHRDKLLEGNLIMIDSVTVVGFRISEAWAKEQHCYFAITFSQPIRNCISYLNKKEIFRTLKDKPDAMVFEFDVIKGKPLMAKVAISPASADGAIANMNAEASHWDFERYKKEAKDVWNKQLAKIEVEKTDKDKATVFYTALYHACIHPSLNMDVNGEFRGMDGQRRFASGYTRYNVFSLWDTYRALHPLFTLIERNKTFDFIQTFLEQYKEGGRLPVWELSSNETDCMIGYHSVSVIADAYAKGIKGFDTELALQAMKAASTYSGFGIQKFGKNYQLSMDDESESVSRTLEYAYDDWCIAQFALKLNKTEDYKYYIRRAQAYKNLFDGKTGFMRPKKNGGWLSPFDPYEVNFHYTEANSWQYSFYVPQDVDGLITLHGGMQKFEQKLDSLFNAKPKTSGREQADITGLIGQYAHGNEPSHHMAYLYNYVGKPEKTQQLVSRIMNEFYKNSPDGLIGNEDCGQMSAWLVFSSLGFYPVCPGSTELVTGQPWFSNATLNLEDGKKFKIESYGDGKQALWLELNGSETFRSAFSYEYILNGGTLRFVFSSPSKKPMKFGFGPMNMPFSRIVVEPLVTNPVISAPAKIFENNMIVKISGPTQKGAKTVYTLNGKDPVRSSTPYLAPITISKTTQLKCKTYFMNDSSSITEAMLYKRPNNWGINILSKYNPQYTAGGDKGIIDGINGDVNWRKGEWQGYQGQDFECVIDLKAMQSISKVKMNCLQDTRAWIVFPKEVSVYISADGKNYSPLGTVVNDVKAEDYTTQLKNFVVDANSKAKARYIKLVAKNFGKLPEWHAGAGGEAFIFVDEIRVQ